MIYIITGHYGSGKTEFAINLAVQKNMRTIVDLDIVNPYFRTADVRDKLNVKVIAPQFANTNVDIPALPPEINSVFFEEGDVLFDVGGDDDGAIALGRYNKEFRTREYTMLFVINARRPNSQNASQIIEMIRNVESVSRLKVTGLVNNTHVMGETTLQHVVEGLEIAKEVGIPIVYNSGIISGLPEPAFYMNKYINVPWEV